MADTSTQPDPFAQLMVDLKADVDTLKGLDPVFDNTIAIVHELDPVPGLIQAVQHAHQVYAEGVETIASLLDDVSDVPGVDSVKGPIQRAIGDVSQIALDLGNLADVATDGLQVVDVGADIADGLGLAKRVVDEALTEIPSVLNTLQILDYVLDIAIPLSKILEGDVAATRLKPLITALMTIKSDVDAAAGPFDRMMSDFNDGASEVIGALQAASSTVLSFLRQAHSGLTRAMDHLDDIIGPLRTLKSAISDIPHCVKSVVGWLGHKFDEVLSHTGLKGLANDLAGLLEGALHFGAEAVGVATGDLARAASSVNTHVHALGKKAAEAWTAAWKTVLAKLGAYAAAPESALRGLIHNLVHAIVNTDIDPDKPPYLPSWPAKPILQPTSKGAERVRPASVRITRARALVPQLVGQPPAPPTEAALATPTLLASLPQSALGDGTTALSSAIVGSTAALGAAQSITTALAAQLQAFDGTKHLPHGLGQELEDLSTILAFAADLSQFSEKQIAPNFPPTGLTASLQDLARASGALPAKAQSVLTAAAPIDNAVEAVLSHAPLESAFTAGIAVLDGWGASAATLCTLIAAGRQLDAAHAHTAAIDAVQHTVQTRAADLAQEVASLGHLAAQAQHTAGLLSAALKTVGEAYGSLADQSELVRTAWQPKLDTLAHDLALADGILKPLGCLLAIYKVGPCPDPNKQIQDSILEALWKTTDPALQRFETALQDGLDQALGRALKLDDTAAAIANAQSAVQTQAPIIEALCQTLSGQLSQLQTQLAKTRTYRREGETTDVSSPLLDQALADQISSLIDAFDPNTAPMEAP